MILDISAFRAAFPAFANETTYPDALLNAKMIIAQCYIEDNSCTFDDSCRQYVYQLMVAHLLAIGNMVTAGTITRQVASATEGPVTVSFSDPPNTSNFIYWLMTTPYGVELAALLSLNAVGNYYGGNYALSAFRQY